MSRLRVVLAVVLTLAAAALGVVALQIHRWESSMRNDDLRFQVSPIAEGLWRAPGGPGAAVAKRMLAVDDDVEFRHAERLFVQVHLGATDYAQETQRLAAFGRAQSTLEALSRHDPSPTRRSRAANLLGILLWEDAADAQENTPLLLRQSAVSFQRAIRAAPGADDAKYNLELLTTVVEPADVRRTDAPEVGGGEGFKGAGAARAGSGY